MRLPTIVLVLTLAVAACSGDDTGSTAGTPGGDASASATGPLPDPCTLMTDAEVEVVTGEAPASNRSAQVTDAYRTCLWSDGSSDFFILTIQTDHEYELIEQAAIARGDDEHRTLDGVGDRAFVELESNVVAEQDGVLVTAQGSVTTVAELEALMPTVLDRLIGA
ncbi:MAG: DUF3558 family protein [Actinomycetota bacterium]